MSANCVALVGCLALTAGCYRSHVTSAEDGGPTDTAEDVFSDAPIDTPEEIPLDAPPDVLPDILRTCGADGEEVVLEGAFEALGANCPWGIDDNIGLVQGVAAARVEQELEWLTDRPAQLCSLRLEAGESTPFRYDDNFFLLAGDVVLASSDADLVERLPHDGDMSFWSWDTIVGEPMTLIDNRPFCLNDGSGDFECTVPPTEQLGSFSLSVGNEDLLGAVFDMGVTLTFVTVGDNDRATDCSHTQVPLRLVVKILPL